MKISVYCGIPGSGKTLTLLDGIVADPRPVLWAGPRTALLDEQADYLRTLATKSNTPLVVEPIHSDQSGARGNVPRRVQAALQSHKPADPAIVLITHETLLGLDPKLVEGRHVIIDEVPDSGVLSDHFSAQSSWHSLAYHYALRPAKESCYSEVVPREEVPPLKRADLTADMSKGLREFQKAVIKGRAVFVDILDWQDTSGSGSKVFWWSVWTPISLNSAASVTITGAGFFNSLVYHATQRFHLDAIVFERIEPVAVQRGQQRFEISYFTCHRGSTPWWEGDDGSRCLVQISDYLKAIKFSGYWSCNNEILPYFWHRFGGERREPKQAGTNGLRHNTSCAYIYSNKACAADAGILKVLGLEPSAIERAREFEDIVQFVLRGAPRDPTWSGTYKVYLYSIDQAETLRDYLIDKGISNEVVLVPVEEAGIMGVGRPARNAGARKVDLRTCGERAAAKREENCIRKRRSRSKMRDALVAQGKGRPRGRPPASAPSR